MNLYFLKNKYMAKKCPKCGSKNTHCVNRGEQVGDFLCKYGSNIAAAALILTGHPKMGNFLKGPSTGEISRSKYKCKSCGMVFY